MDQSSNTKHHLRQRIQEVTSRHGSCHKNQLIQHYMQVCPHVFNCSYVEDIAIGSLIGEGAVKRVHKGIWSNHIFAINLLRQPQFSQDFFAGLSILQLLNASPHVVKLIGFCKERRIFLTEFHKFGDARNVHNVLKKHSVDSIENRLRFCMSYTEILEFLHSNENGVRVMCDSNDLQKTLSQYLVTDGLRLILNDVDAVPALSEAPNKKIRCGHREIISPFAAPEQLWPYRNLTYNREKMGKYTEKTDIWKVPDVCEYFLGSFSNHKVIKYRLFEIHKSCKSERPERRPSAAEIKSVYEDLLHKLFQHA